MELKKSPKADLENKRNIFVQIGLVVSLAICLYAFDSTSKVKQVDSLGKVQEQAVEEEIIPVTRQEEVKPPPPPPPPKVVDILNIVDNNMDIKDELQIEDTEANDKTAINAVMQVAPQEKEKEKEDTQVFFIVEDMPEFPGGMAALQKFIAQAIKYPVIAQENGIQGKVFVNFVVNTDGSVTDAKIARGVDPSLDKEALRVVMTLPKWKPGRQGGKPVRVSYTVPINFQLQ